MSTFKVLDGVQGLYHPVEAAGREPNAARDEMERQGDLFLAHTQAEAVQMAMLQFLEMQPIEKYHSRLKSILEDKTRRQAVQAKSLGLLVKGRDAEAAGYVRAGLKGANEPVKLVEERAKGVSLMPEGLGERLSQRDLRDLAAYLAGLKAPVQAPSTKKE